MRRRRAEKITVLTWLWNQPGGRTRYTAGHVNIWAAMLDRHLTIPHRKACVTDMPVGLRQDIEVIPPPRCFEDVRIPTWGPHMPQCLRRIAMFRRDAADWIGSERFVCMDVDCIVSASLDPVFSRREDLVLYRGTAGSHGRRPYNGSLLMMTAGARPSVFEQFTPQGAVAAGRKYIGSDQAWISHILGYGEATFGDEHGVQWWGRFSQASCRVLFFPGFPKPWKLVGRDGWVTQHYRGAEGGRCLILGGGPEVWRDAATAGEYDAVIAIREAAEHWPGPIREIVADEDEAHMAAKMHGFDEIVWCGRTGGLANVA